MNRHLIGGLAVAIAALGVAMGAQRSRNRSARAGEGMSIGDD